MVVLATNLRISLLADLSAGVPAGASLNGDGDYF
jgi:hypothetical protein